MLTKDDFERKPKGFIYCYGDGCGKAEGCLRHMALEFLEPDVRSFEVFNPQCVCHDGVCDRFLTSEPVEMKYGLKKFYGKLPHEMVKPLKAELLKVFGKSEYYRKYRYEHPFTPGDQKLVKRVFEAHGVGEEPEYEYSKMEIEW